MGRPRLALGTYGEIRHYPTDAGGWRAETLFRDMDGRTRPVKRSGKTKGQATRALKEALLVRQHHSAAGELTRNSLFSDCAERWLVEVQRTGRGTTYDRYRNQLSRILPVLGQLRLHEIGTGTCDRFLISLLDAGLQPATVRGYRARLSGIMRYAIRMGAIDRNPVRDVADIRGKGKRSRALTPTERVELLEKLDGDPEAVEADLPSLIRYALGSGCRIGEILALQWSNVDLELGIAIHGATLVRETRRCQHCGEYRAQHPTPGWRCPKGDHVWEPGPGGLVLHPPKTSAGVRIIRLPQFVIDMLRLRYPGEEYTANPVFSNAVGEWRDPINTVRKIREWRQRAGFEWFSSHTCRHTMFTICDQAGVSPRESAGHGGHTDPSFTARNYYDLKQQSGAVAEALDAAYRPVRS